jgi:CubicO group peptidase (beta-lactamase class C family)
MISLQDVGSPPLTTRLQPTPDDAWPQATWPTASPEDVNIDPALPSILSETAAQYTSVTGVVMARHGQLVADYWADGWSPSDPIDIRSCTKSVVSALVGRCLVQGLLPNLSVTIDRLIPDRIPDGADPAVSEITLRSLLTMTSGLQWDWRTDYERLEAAANPVELTLSQPVVASQGETYVYNSGGTHIIGLMVAAASGMPLEDYAEASLLQPLGITATGWRRTPQGEVIGGYGLQMVPADMLRLGLLYLRDGRWRNQQLLEPTYIDQSTIVQSSGDPTGGTAYGYQWWVTNASGDDAFFALGYGGQYIYTVPALDLTVAVAVGDIGGSLVSPRPLIESTIIPLVYPD